MREGPPYSGNSKISRYFHTGVDKGGVHQSVGVEDHGVEQVAQQMGASHMGSRSVRVIWAAHIVAAGEGRACSLPEVGEV